jgi:hypothetical protein
MNHRARAGTPAAVPPRALPGPGLAHVSESRGRREWRRRASGTRRWVDARDVTRAIRRDVWPVLGAAGFDSFTGRSAWRYVEATVDVVNFQSFNASIADAVGCTPFSFSLNLGVWAPGDDPPQLKRDPKGRVRPQEWQCGRRTHLDKSIVQPWFEPFSRGDTARWPRGLRLHREGLKRVLRRDRHDRPDTWFVLPDGTNLAEVVDDALRAIREEGFTWFESTRAADNAEGK